MTMHSDDEQAVSPGIQKYIDTNNEYLERRDKYIDDVVKNLKFDTIAVHGLYTVEDAIEDYDGAIIEPVFLSSSQAYRDSDELEAALAYLIPTWCYSRIANPTTYYYEWTLALLEGYDFDGGTSCCSTSSGMAAIMMAVQPFLVHTKEHVFEERNFLATAQCYGGTYQLFSVRLEQERGVECRWIEDPTDIDAWASRIDENTRFLYGELPSNPQQGFFDIEAVADLAHSHGLPLIIDSTVATPVLTRPLELGADIVVHSATKYLNGHSDVIGGAIVSEDRDLGERIRDQQRISGPVPGPLDCWLVLRGIKTLHVRMKRHCENAERIAEFLVGHPAAGNVLYPGLPTHPQHELARRQMQGFGGMISFDAGSFERARTVVASTRLFQLAESLGGVESLISVPAEMTHASVPAEVREKIGLTNGLVRLSVGIESADDLIADLQHALDQP